MIGFTLNLVYLGRIMYIHGSGTGVEEFGIEDWKQWQKLG